MNHMKDNPWYKFTPDGSRPFPKQECLLRIDTNPHKFEIGTWNSKLKIWQTTNGHVISDYPESFWELKGVTHYQLIFFHE